MKKFSTPSLLVLIAVFAFTAVTAQTLKSASQNTTTKPASIQKQAPQIENTNVGTETQPASTNDALKESTLQPDAIINIKDEKQYLEQKKKEQEKNIKNEKEVNTPK